MPNTYACKGVSNPNVPIFLPRVCTLVLFISIGIIIIIIIGKITYARARAVGPSWSRKSHRYAARSTRI